MIANELKRYYRYVHNKKVGGASRVDVARGFWWHGRGKEHQSEQSKEYGAIVYTFVGAGAKAGKNRQKVEHIVSNDGEIVNSLFAEYIAHRSRRFLHY